MVARGTCGCTGSLAAATPRAGPGGYRQVGLDTDEMQREVESCKYTALVNAQVQKAGNRRDRRPDLCAE